VSHHFVHIYDTRMKDRDIFDFFSSQSLDEDELMVQQVAQAKKQSSTQNRLSPGYRYESA